MSQQSGRTMRESEENGNGNGHKQQKEEEQAKKRTVHVVQVFGFAWYQQIVIKSTFVAIFPCATQRLTQSSVKLPPFNKSDGSIIAKVSQFQAILISYWAKNQSDKWQIVRPITRSGI